MNLIIDGHNLIAKIPGLSLSMPDDEQSLIDLLVSFSQLGGHWVEAYFDGAPPGQSGVRSFGRVKAYFVTRRSSADAAIRRRLHALGKTARDWVVVSSDRSVQAAAREARARVVEADDFAARLEASQQAGEGDSLPAPDQPLSEAELSEWEAIFSRKRKPKAG